MPHAPAQDRAFPPPGRRPGRARSIAAKDQVREALIAAGRALIARDGLGPVSLRQIARHAHYSPGVVYRYFPDKAALFLAIRDHGLGAFAAQVARIVDTGTDPEATLRAIAEAGFGFALEQAANFGMNMLTVLWNKAEGEDATLLPHVRDPSPPGAHVHRLYERAILALFDAIGGRPVGPDMAVATFMSAITGAVALPAGSAHGDFPDRVAVMRSSVDTLIAGWKSQVRAIGRTAG